MIETVFERYAALRHRPFTFLSQRDEIVAAAAKKARLTHPLLADFMILPKFSLHAKVIEPADGESRVGLLVTLGMRYEANADLLALEAAGVDLTGLYVVRRNVQPGQRRLAGRISHLAKDVVHLSEATDEETIATSAVRLAPIIHQVA